LLGLGQKAQEDGLDPPIVVVVAIRHLVCPPIASTDVNRLSCKIMAKTDTVGELGSVENCASRMASCKAHDHGNASAERWGWKGRNRFANSILVGFRPG
jgi:hypothetical protein